MVFNVQNISGEADLLVVKEYGPENENLTVEMLTEVFVVVYTYLKRGVKEPTEIYTFTTDFDQALKRFKLLPACKCLLKRFLTDDENLIELAISGTKPKVEMTDLLNNEATSVQIKEIMDRYNDDDVDRTGITIRELNDDELEILAANAKPSSLTEENPNKTENIFILNAESTETENNITRKDIQDNEPEQSEVVYREHDSNTGETHDTTSARKEEL